MSANIPPTTPLQATNALRLIPGVLKVLGVPRAPRVPAGFSDDASCSAESVVFFVLIEFSMILLSCSPALSPICAGRLLEMAEISSRFVCIEGTL